VTKPEPYEFCSVHFKAKCPICSPVAQPNPDLSVAPTKPTTEVVPAQPVPPPPPQLTNPKAQKIVEAARKYAEAVEAAAIISDQLAQAQELVAALEQKLSETRKNVEEAMKETKTP
jgi:hypothetical protein